MTGFIGSALDAATPDACMAELHHGDWYKSAAQSISRFGASVFHHDTKDPEGCTVWEDDPCTGAIYGAVTNLNELELDVDRLFARLFEDPHALLPEFDGSFPVIAVGDDARRAVLASDKLETRQCFCVADKPFASRTEVGALTILLNDPQIDERAISNLLIIGHVWGNKMPVQGVELLPSGIALDYRTDTGPELDSY